MYLHLWFLLTLIVLLFTLFRTTGPAGEHGSTRYRVLCTVHAAGAQARRRLRAGLGARRMQPDSVQGHLQESGGAVGCCGGAERAEARLYREHLHADTSHAARGAELQQAHAGAQPQRVR